MVHSAEEEIRTSHDPQHPTILSVDYEDAFELTGHGLFNYIALAACSLIFIHASLEMAAIAYVITPAECDLQLSVSQKSMINSGIFIGVLITAIFWGAISDRFGRRKVMLPALFGAVITSFMSSLCTGFYAMLGLRILTGCLVSASSATVLVYLGEVQTIKHRAFSITFTMTITQITFALLPALAWIIIPRSWSFFIGPVLVKPWRMFMWSWGIIGLTGAFILLILPESPRFILASKGPFETLPVLARMYAWNHGKKKHDYPVTSMRTCSSGRLTTTGNTGFKKSLKDTYQLIIPPMRRCFLITHYGMFVIFLLCYGLYIWLPDFLNDVVADITLPESICDLINRKYLSEKNESATNSSTCNSEVNTNTYPMAMGMESTYLVPFLIVIVVIDKYDKKIIYGIVMCTCTVGLIVTCLVPQILVAMITIVIGINCCTGASILSAYTVDAFPTSLRSLVMCTMYMMGQIGAVVGNNIISLMSGVFCQILFFLLAFSAMASAGLIWQFWPDLKVVRAEMESRQFSY